jgi:hypothetical protein
MSPEARAKGVTGFWLVTIGIVCVVLGISNTETGDTETHTKHVTGSRLVTVSIASWVLAIAAAVSGILLAWPLMMVPAAVVMFAWTAWLVSHVDD